MKRITKLFLLLVIALMAVSPAFAFGAVSGTVIDAELNGWQWGGEVFVYRAIDGELTAVCFLSQVPPYGVIVDENGGTCNYGDMDTSGVGMDGSAANVPPSLVDPAHGTGMEVYIDFLAGPQGDPGDTTMAYNEIDFPPAIWENRVKGLGYINTGAGPNAITLNDFAAQSSNPALFILAGVALLALASGALVIARKRLA